jgi:outer membrane lipoprotein SlyB
MFAIRKSNKRQARRRNMQSRQIAKQISAAMAAVAALSLGACATESPGYSGASHASQASYSGKGTVQSVEVVKEDTKDGIGLGTVAGAVIGGVLGHQIGEGGGNTAATVAGAAGGAYAGHRIEESRREARDAYRVNMRMDNGEYRSFVQASDNGLRAGDRAVVHDGVAQRD